MSAINSKNMVAPSVEYKGVAYYIQSNGRYYTAYFPHLGKRMLLHRKIWEDHNGKIPEGYDVHHKDEDWTNNEISNLEIMHRSEHMSLHMKERWQTEEFREKTIKQLDLARGKASEWHKSEEGKSWHSEMQKEAWAKKQTVTKVCLRCGKQFETFFPNRGNFCSDSCSHYSFMQNSEKLKRECKHCKVPFEHSKHQKRMFCCKSCAGKYNNAVRNGTLA